MGSDGGFGKCDCVGQVDWFRQFRVPRTREWFRADSAGDPVAFNSTHAIRANGGGYLRLKGDNVYRFPLELIDLSNGSRNEMVLAVPFDGKFEMPRTNFSVSTAPDGTEVNEAAGVHLLGVTAL